MTPTPAERLKKMQDSLAKHEADFLAQRPPRGQKATDPIKLDGLAAEIRRIRLEIDALLGLPPAGPTMGRPRPVPKFRPKVVGIPRPGQDPHGRAPDWRKGKGKPER
jgi:hypothetical protein